MTGDVETMGIARWDTRLAVPEYVFGTEPNDFLLSQRHRLQPGMRALIDDVLGVFREFVALPDVVKRRGWRRSISPSRSGGCSTASSPW